MTFDKTLLDDVPVTSARRHAPAVAFAIVSSMALHAALFVGLPGFSFEIFERADKPREHSPVELSERMYDASDTASRPERFRAEDPELKVDLPSQVTRFKHAIDDATTTPRPVPNAVSSEAIEDVLDPARGHARATWIPRQEILKIDESLNIDKVDSSPRRLIPNIERVAHAPDVVMPVDSDRTKALAGSSPPPSGGSPGTADIASRPTGTASVPPNPAGTTITTGSVVPDETPAQVTGVKQIENLLTFDAQTFTGTGDDKFGYVKIDIARIDQKSLPRMPKDIVLLQDSSTSMTEQKLHFCRNGLLRIVEDMGPDDRFNVISFSDGPVKCFDQWSASTPDAVRKAQEFVRNMKASGETDLFASLRGLMQLKRSPGRPLIAYVVTDGRPTTGVTDSTEIIERFSKLNKGAISVFTMGTVTAANSYLLDLLSYRNRGDSFVVRKGRWDIPESMERRFREVSRPVLADLRYAVSKTTPCEVYPLRLTNLYLDRPLVLYGRYPLNTKQAVFQIVGAGKDAACDMIFSVKMNTAAKGDRDIRKQWAWHKVYHLIGKYTETRDKSILDEIRRTGSEYHIKVPYDIGK